MKDNTRTLPSPITPVDKIENRKFALQFVSDVARGKALNIAEMMDYTARVANYIETGETNIKTVIRDNQP